MIKGKLVVIDNLNLFKTMQQSSDPIPDSAVVFIKNEGQIWTKGSYFGVQKTYDVVSKTDAGLAPKGGDSASSLIANVDDEWVLTVTNGANPSWRKLPANAFKNQTYTFYNLAFKNSSDTTVDTYKPSTSPSKSVKAGTNVEISASSNTITISATDTTYNAFTGASDSVDGSLGLVPKPTKGNQSKFLKADGSWATPTDTIYTLPTASSSTLGGVKTGAAIDSTSGYTAVHINNGVIYYKNTTYSTKAMKVNGSTYNVYTSSTSLPTIYAPTAVGTAGQVLATNSNADGLEWKSVATTTKAMKVNGTNYNIYTTGTSLPTIYAPTSLGTAGQVLKMNGDGTGFTWATDATIDTWRPVKALKSDGTALGTLSDNSTTLSLKAGSNITLVYSSGTITITGVGDTWTALGGATASTDGTAGYAPKPTKGQQGYYLKGNATWVKPSLSEFTDDVVAGNYLSLNGGTLTGSTQIPLTISTTFTHPSTNLGVVGLAIKSATSTNSAGYDGLFGWSETGGLYMFNAYNYSNVLCAIGITNDGIPYIGQGENLNTKYKIWHENNDGSGSGLDADTLDGNHATQFFGKGWWNEYNHNKSISTLEAVNSSTNAWNSEANVTLKLVSSNNAIVLSAGGTSNERVGLIQVGHASTGYAQHTGSLYLNKLGGKVYIGTTEAATINSNVASATKLQTARTIWGQSFDGSGNVDGNISSSNQTFNVFANNGKEILSYSTENKYLSLGYGTLADSFTTYLHGYNINLRYGANGTDGLILNSSGNVGIGTTSPSCKLHVAGPAVSNSWNLGTLGLGTYKIGLMTLDSTHGLYFEGPNVNNTHEDVHLPITFSWRGGYASWGGIQFEGSSGGKSIIIKSPSTSLRLFAWGDATYIESGNSDFSANALLNISGISGRTGSNLWLNFDTITCGEGSYTNIHSGNIGNYAVSAGDNLLVANLGINNTRTDSTNGISLYSNCDFVTSYGILFTGTSTFGGQFGDVLTGDWATYFTMDGGATTPGANVRGWIFRHKTGGNKVSIGADGNIQCTAWYRTIGDGGWYNETYKGGWYMEDSSFIRSYGTKPLHINIAYNNTWAAGGHRLAADFYGIDHVAIQLRNNTCSWSVCSNENRNLYFGYRSHNSVSDTTGDCYPLYVTPNGTLYLNEQALTFVT